VKARTVLSVVGWPILFGAVFLAVWEGIVKVFDLKPYFLPAPSAIGEAFVDNVGVIREATFHSGANALVGLIAGHGPRRRGELPARTVPGAHRARHPAGGRAERDPDRRARHGVHQHVRLTTEVPRRLMVTLIVFFIVLVNVAKGLRQVHPTHLELLRSYAASPSAVLVKARIPNAIPYLFTALKIAAPASVITAFVAEYFGGRQVGLGTRITSNFANSRNAVAWAYVLGACLLGLAFYLISIAMESTTRHRRGSAPGGA
jgi:NitT/TauT family transport system permease protein